MKNAISILFLLSLFLLGFSKDEPKEVPSELKKVTVFLNGAQATRTAKVTLPKGISQLKFIGLPARINSKSIQVKGEGNFSILSQTNAMNIPDPAPVDETATKRIEEIQEEKKGLKELIAVENNLLKVYKMEEALLMANQNFGTKDNGIKVDDLRAAADLFRTRLMEITKLKQEILDKIKGYQKQMVEMNKEVVELQKPKEPVEKLPDPTTEVWVTVSTKATVTGTFTITYLVINAGWLPSYDLKVADVSKPVQLTYKASVFQNSNEDWKGVELTLSTGNPNKNNVKPALYAWKLNYYTPNVPNYGDRPGNSNIRTLTGRVMSQTGEALIGATIVAKGTTVGTFADESGNFSLTIPDGATQVVISYLGYQTQERPIAGSTLNVAMLEDVTTLDEVVVTSYDKEEAMMDDMEVTTISRSEIKNIPIQLNSLSGKAAGVSIRSSRYKIERERKVKEKAETKTIPLIVNRVERATNVEFTIDTPYDIPSDGKRYSVDMKVHEIPATYEYYCAPKLDLNAYLTAQISDWEDLNLLEGESNVYFEETYIGKTLLSVRSIEDTLSVSLGADAAIVVSRTRLKNYSKKQFMGGKHIETRAWDIEVRSQKKQSVDIVIEDQYPVSDNAEIEVEHIDHKGADHNLDTGILTWDLKLGASKSKTVGLKYSVKFPKGKAIRIE